MLERRVADEPRPDIAEPAAGNRRRKRPVRTGPIPGRRPGSARRCCHYEDINVRDL